MFIEVSGSVDGRNNALTTVQKLVLDLELTLSSFGKGLTASQNLVS